MKPSQFLILIFLTCFNLNCQTQEKIAAVQFGADVLVSSKLELLSGKKVGLLINQTSLLKNGTALIDTLQSLNINITTIFSPEHGLLGNIEAGDLIEYTLDTSDINYFSLYGNTRKPTDDMLDGIDIILVDLQDIGARFYTYISTMYYVQEAAAENGVSVLILDRPNPLGGEKIEGPVLGRKFKSFIGIAEIPAVHGMTIGELAILFKDIIDKKIHSKLDLQIIKMENWSRDFNWKDLDRDWVPTSPNIPDFETAIIYPGTCLLEATNISEGRGTENPFKIIGAPFINSEELIAELDKFNIKGIEILPESFIPEKIRGKSVNPKYESENCNGFKITVKDFSAFNSFEFGVKLVFALHNLYPQSLKFQDDYFDKLAGNDQIRKMILNNDELKSILSSWQDGLNQFKELRKNYLLY